VLPAIEKNLPSGVKIAVPYDATKYIRDAIHDVLTTLTETVLIVVLVIFLFIGSLRATLVPVVAIPLSLVGATALMLDARLHHQSSNSSRNRFSRWSRR